MRRKRVLAGMLGTAAVASIGAFGIGLAQAEPAAGPGRSDIDWGQCPKFGDDIEQLPQRESLECGTMTVPLDYSEPGGATIEVAVSRLASDKPDKRRGVLLLNPGGPGQSGLDLPVYLGSRAPAELLAGYDLIGFDPRGVGATIPSTCGLSAPESIRLNPSHPVDGDASVAERLDEAGALARQCRDNDLDGLFPHLSTRNVVRDMDQLRKALGEERISYFGTSYGTYLGAAYAEVHPKRTDRFLLDSAVDPEGSWREVCRQFGKGGEIALAEFAGWAARYDEVYGLGSTPKQVRRTYFRLAEGLDTAPVSGMDGTTFRWMTFLNLYSPHTFTANAELWQSLNAGEAPAIPEGQSTGEVPADNDLAALTTITCADADWPDSVEGYQKDVAADGERYPAFGAMMANAWTCAGWDAKPREPMIELDDDGRSNIMILQNTKDPATTYAGGVEMRLTLGDRARMVTVDEVGHSVYLYHGNTCAAEYATKFLLGGKPLSRDRYCEAEIPLPDPTGGN